MVEPAGSGHFDVFEPGHSLSAAVSSPKHEQRQNMSTVLSLAACVAGIATLSVLIRAYLGARALSAAVSALNELNDEVVCAAWGGEKRYSTRMPARDAFEREKNAGQDILTLLHERLQPLQKAGLLQKLSKSFRQQCLAIELRARKAKTDLQDEAFWAQFPPGSAAAESRFKNEPQDIE